MVLDNFYLSVPVALLSFGSRRFGRACRPGVRVIAVVRCGTEG